MELAESMYEIFLDTIAYRVTTQMSTLQRGLQANFA